MTTQPRQYRRSSWLSFAYLLAAIIVLGIVASSAMDFIHGGTVLTPSILQILSVAGDVIGVLAIILLLVRQPPSNSNVRVAILATFFGLLIFGLATVASTNHPAASPTGAEVNPL